MIRSVFEPTVLYFVICIFTMIKFVTHVCFCCSLFLASQVQVWANYRGIRNLAPEGARVVAQVLLVLQN